MSRPFSPHHAAFVKDQLDTAWDQYAAEKKAANERPEILEFFAWLFYRQDWTGRKRLDANGVALAIRDEQQGPKRLTLVLLKEDQ